jgi:predicted lipid-binding transport protein (Tim44 family)
MGGRVNYNEFLSTVHARYSSYGTNTKYAHCFVECLLEERPEIVERLRQTGRVVRKRNGEVRISQEVWNFIKDIW